MHATDRRVPAAPAHLRGARPFALSADADAPPPHLRAAALFRGSGRMSPLLAGALAAACECPGRAPTVGELARMLGVNRVTLDRHWNRIGEGTPPLRLLDVLGWIVLLRARHAYTELRAWTRAAPRAGTSRNTVARLAASLAGMSVLEVENDFRELQRRFEDRVLRHLV
jgi:AraC-like DNA-binding protein